MSRQVDYVVRNGPIPVNFAGLQGTTMAMQNCGWEICMEEVGMRYNRGGYSFRIAGRHSGMNLKMLSYPCELSREIMGSIEHCLPQMEFNIMLCAEQISMRAQEMPKFNAVDWSRPETVQAVDLDLGKHFSLEQCCFFKPMNNEVDIYLPEKKIWTLKDSLKEILAEQADEQAEIRDRVRKRRDNNSGDQSYNNLNAGEVKLQLVAI